MKIVSVMTGAGPGGAEFAAVELLDALSERGHEVVMLSNRAEIGRDTGVPTRPLELGPKLSGGSWPMLLAKGVSLQKTFRQALERELPYDVLLLHFKKEQLLAMSLPTRLKPRIVWAEWGPLPHQLMRGPARQLYVKSSRQVASVLAISEGTRQSLIDVGVEAAKVTVVPNALRTGELTFSAEGRERVRREFGISSDAFVVGCTSRLHPAKRLDVLIDAFPQLEGRPHLILAGDGEHETALRERARPLGERVHFLPTPTENVNELFSSFDVCVFCPSLIEGSPTSVILGMLASRPCISTAAEGVGGLISDGVGTVVAPEHNPAALASVMSEYASDPERVRREGARAAARAREGFDAASVIDLAEQLIIGGPDRDRPSDDPANRADAARIASEAGE